MISSVGRIEPWRQRNWDWRAAGNFIGGGSGSGLLLSVPFAGDAAAPRLTLLGLALIGAGLLCVWLEIGRPWRALNVYRRPASSWMTREALLAPLLFACGAAVVWRAGRTFESLLAGLALAYVYCQARMLQGGRGIPAWRHPRVVPLLVTTAIAEGFGLGLAVLAATAMGVIPASLPWLTATALLARGAVLIVYRGALAGKAPTLALAALDEHIVVDRLLTAAAMICLLAGATIAGGRWLLVFGGLAALAAGSLLKYTIVVRASFNQGFALPLLPVRGPGRAAPGARPGW
ncbi:MAG TPA: DmsC/YnfH family molybdoenzyme membrane anchor subunit [Steroidobacteraceae bacterium]|nr:DmsC/YnfH family molybdoenzyme membrane anchor subunit [Steroidobacteraceae bacterium]